MPFRFVKNKGTRIIINLPTSPIVRKSFVQTLIVVSIIESSVVLLATHNQKESPVEGSTCNTVEI